MSLEQWIRGKRQAGDEKAAKLGQALLSAFGDVQLSSEAQTEVRSFSPEAREALEKQGYIIYQLSGKSVRQLREAGNQFSSTWHRNYPDFEVRGSEAVEVAVNPRELFLKGSNRKTLSDQEHLVSKFSSDLSRRISGVKAVIGEANQYAELAFLHLDASGQRLFGEKYRYDYARTKTPVGSRVALVGAFGGDGLRVARWNTGHVRGSIWAAPLVVPA